MMRFLKTMIFTGLLVLASVGAAQDAAPTAMPACYDADLGWWREQDWSCTIEYEVTVTQKVDISYPRDLEEKAPFTASIMQSYLNAAYDAIHERSKDGFSWSLIYGSADRPTVYLLKIDYEQFSYSETITTVVFNQIMAGGPGHGAVPHFRSFTFDLENEKVLTLEDIFREDVHPYQTVGYTVYQQLQEQVAPQYFELLGRGLFEDEQPYRAWALTQNSLDFFFSGELTGEYGEEFIYRVSIPLADLQDSLRPEFATQRLFG